MDMETVQLGQEFTIKSIRDRENPIVRKLYAMGLKEGKRARLLLKNGRVYLLRLNNSRLIIDRDLARFIEVA
ncbi:ferrous iron transport protein A [Hydrogenivirga caldilitoris]|uniref:Ferrous iron transport protein A n=1 Tax=Hydrogenivirga caldilitoris TaxID=246264 RepID=A0A497XN00_9AQUI|nr:FeoA family protein [Hydrogenivirga caldilitoris]RLJ70295.1 ferrous iron transport protein A [Hydrogenivirga caldilitoris]